jgi:hypothetical protein
VVRLPFFGDGDVTATEANAEPHAEYTQRLVERRRRAAHEESRQRVTGNVRVGVVLLVLALGYPILVTGQLGIGWLALPVVLFVLVSILHDRVTRAWRRAKRAVEFYEHGLARLENRWAGHGKPGERFLDPAHPYALDLDIFGVGSVFELLCTAQTSSGQETLADWLLHPANAGEIEARQRAVAELRPRLDLREEIAQLGANVPEGTDLHGLAVWGAAPLELVSPHIRIVATILGGAAILTLIGWGFLHWSASPFLVVVFLESLFAVRLRGRVLGVIQPVEKRGPDLLLLAGLLVWLESERFTAPKLVELQQLVIAGVPPSQRMARLAKLLDWLDSRRNAFFAPFAALLLWSIHMAFAVERWRSQTGPAIGLWVRLVGEFEALSALATYAYENDSDSFPEITADGPRFLAEDVGHPLLPRKTCVMNDVNLGEGLSLLVVSGSNMSGKSTLLRTVGVNAVLALAGAPVRARRLRLSPVAIGATLRIQDSLREGKSRFYAEIVRVRQLVDLARGPLPLLFLLDEVFQGTNSHDRRLGAEAVVSGLVKAGAIGLITTHDLALTHIAEHLGSRGANVHFEDHFENGAMTFDYRMLEGVVQKSNALALMRAVGLDV